MYLFKERRIVHGLELLRFHSIPVSPKISHTMGCHMINVEKLSHRAQCRLAGNSMHCACVGAVVCALLLFGESGHSGPLVIS